MEHPITTGILQKVKELSVTVQSAENFNAITGNGVEAPEIRKDKSSAKQGRISCHDWRWGK